MKQYFRIIILILTTIALSHQSLSASEEQQGVESNSSPVDLLSKVVDSNYLDFQPLGYIELPRFFYAEDGFHFFRSTTSALNSDRGFIDVAYLENEPETEGGVVVPATYELTRAEGEPQILFDFSITKHLVWFWFGVFIVFIIFIPLARKYQRGVGRTTEPNGVFQNIFETLVLFIRDNVARPNIPEDKYEKFMPYLLTAFFSILFMNLFGLLPWGVSSTADVTVTAALAVLTFFATQIFASKDHWKHIFWFPDVPVFIKIMMIPVEIVGQFTKPFALCIRLFANMTSGKILIFSLISAIFIIDIHFGAIAAYGSSIFWIGLTLFVYILKAFIAFIQAYVFVILSALFIGLATEEHDHHHGDEHAVEHAHS